MKLVSIARISSEKGIREALYFLKAAELEKGVECIFYGTQQDEDYLHACQQLASEITGAAISFPGEISPEEISSAMQDAHFFYMATWGENFGHAIAEALQLGKPVIISDRTPWRNLAAEKAGWDLPLEEDAFVEILRKCHAMSQDEYNIWSTGASTFGCTHANDPRHLQAYYSLFE